VYWWSGFWGLLPPKEAFSAGVFAALRAIEIDNTLAQTHALLASFRKELDYNWPEVERETKLALELNPTSPIVRFRTGSWLMPQGRLTELVAELEMALEYDPVDLNARCWLGVVHWLARRYDEAIKQAHLVLEIDPKYPFGHLLLGQTRCMEHKFDEALIALAESGRTLRWRAHRAGLAGLCLRTEWERRRGAGPA
jgi:tetratricopeptide (TPR) repeat protein